MRVVSVLPSATEIVCALGHGPELVGRSSECDYPPEVERLPPVMRPRTLDAQRPSREIDERVRRARGREESLYTLDLELLRTLRPDVLLTQNLCGVCSVTDAEAREACERAGVRPQVVSLAPTRLSEVWDSIETVAAHLEDRSAGQRLADDCRQRSRGSPPTGRRVAIVEWLDPPILAGLWAPDIVTAAGAVAVGPAAGSPGSRTDWTALSQEKPDLVLLSPCSFRVPRTLRELTENEALCREVEALHPPLGSFVADEAYFSRPGPRLADGIDLVHALLAGRAPSGAMPVEPFPSSKGARVRS